LLLCITAIAGISANVTPAGQYKNFRVAIYIPVGVVEQMKDQQWLERTWNTISQQLRVDKVYIETYRSKHIVDEQLIERLKKFFLDHGVAVAGGIAHTAADARQFETFSYAEPNEREYVKRISELTARHFDEIILADFFFHMSKSDSDIAAKGDRSWTE